MKIPPSGDNFRVGPTGPNDPGKADSAQGPQGPAFEKTLGTGQLGAPDAVARNAQANAAEGAHASELRAALAGVDKSDPKAADIVAGKLVEWTLSERFGTSVHQARGMDKLKESVKEQLLNDPQGEAKIKNILARL